MPDCTGDVFTIFISSYTYYILWLYYRLTDTYSEFISSYWYNPFEGTFI